MNRTLDRLRPLILSGLSLAMLLAGCASQTRLNAITPPKPGAAWHLPDGFKLAEPSDARIPADWWKLYQDSALDGLEQKVAAANQTLAQADAQYRLAQATLASTRSTLFPSINLSAGATRSQQPILTSAGGLASPPASNLFTVSGQASWEPDLWGAVRANLQSAEASAQASGAQRAATLLSLQGQLAASYFQLQVEDATLQVLEEAIRIDQQSLDLTTARFHAGIAARSDVTQAQSQLENARAQKVEVQATRAVLEHAIAVLVGESAGSFALPASPWVSHALPAVPLALPSTLLERRPDVANAERLAASNAAKLIATEAAFFPVLTLNLQSGFESKQLAHLLSLPKSFWSLGPSLSQFLYDGGNHTALHEEAMASLDQASANYREVVLEAIQGVADNLSNLSLLEEEQARDHASVAAAQESLRLIQDQYRAGTVAYLSVIVTQTTLLNARIAELNVESRKLVAHVQLIRALGGGWESPAPAVSQKGT